MMTSRSLLAGLLVVQLLLAGLLYWNNQAQSGPQAEALLTITMVDRLRISDGEQSVVLARTADDWIIQDEKQSPADNARVNRLLDRLSSLQTGWPVTTSITSHARFEVAADSFQRHVEIYADSTLVSEFWLGTSPGFRKAHLRRSGDDAVYTVNLNSFELPATAADWLPPPPPPTPPDRSEDRPFGEPMPDEGDSRLEVLEPAQDIS